MKKDVNEIKREMTNFFGTVNYYRVSNFCKNFLMTDGVQYVAENCESYWLIENIMFGIVDSISKIGRQDFIVVTCVTKKGKMKISFTDGNNNEIKIGRRYSSIPFTDFPLEEITFWVENNGRESVILLPTEH